MKLWSLFNDEYLILSLIKQIKRKRVSRTLVRELAKRGLLDKILETLERDREFAESFRETIEFIKSVAVAHVVQETLGREWRFPEKLAEYPEIVSDWLREDFEEILDVFEDNEFVYKVVFDGDLRIIPMWKL